MKEISVDANGKIVNVVRGIVGACKNKNYSQMACGGASSHGCDCLLRGTFRNTAKSDNTKVAGANDSNPQQQTPVKKLIRLFPENRKTLTKTR